MSEPVVHIHLVIVHSQSPVQNTPLLQSPKVDGERERNQYENKGGAVSHGLNPPLDIYNLSMLVVFAEAFFHPHSILTMLFLHPHYSQFVRDKIGLRDFSHKSRFYCICVETMILGMHLLGCLKLSIHNCIYFSRALSTVLFKWLKMALFVKREIW